jgi:hypothetical protein
MPTIYVIYDANPKKKASVFYTKKDANAAQKSLKAAGASFSVEKLRINPQKLPRVRGQGYFYDDYDGKWYVKDNVEKNLMRALDYNESSNKHDVERRGNALMHAYHYINEVSGIISEVLMMAAAGATGDEMVEIIKEVDGWSDVQEQMVRSIRALREKAEAEGRDILAPFRDQSEEMQERIRKHLDETLIAIQEKYPSQLN